MTSPASDRNGKRFNCSFLIQVRNELNILLTEANWLIANFRIKVFYALPFANISECKRKNRNQQNWPLCCSKFKCYVPNSSYAIGNLNRYTKCIWRALWWDEEALCRSFDMCANRFALSAHVFSFLPSISICNFCCSLLLFLFRFGLVLLCVRSIWNWYVIMAITRANARLHFDLNSNNMRRVMH